MKPQSLEATFDPAYQACFKTLDGLRGPRVTRNVVGLIALALLLLGAGLYWIPWLQTATGTGQLIALDPAGRVQSVTAAVSGRIGTWHVHDGDRVRKGDPLVEIVDNDPLLEQRLEAELAATRSRLEATRSAMETARLAARRDFEAAIIRHKELKAATAAIAADVAKAEVQRARQSTQRIVAPREGVILRIAGGDASTFVKEGDELVVFAPEQGLRATEIFVSGLDAALVQPGRKVRLMFEGWPAVQFSGWPSMAIGTFAGVVRFVDPAASVNGRFRAVVVEDPAQPWPGERYLRLGGKARGWVVLNEVRLGYELWRQLNNFPPEGTPAVGERS